MKNIFIHNLNQKDVQLFTTNTGLFLRRKLDKQFKILCHIFTKANIIKINTYNHLSNDEYFNTHIIRNNHTFKENKSNIILERYPKLNKNEPYIFICNHNCPEDIETILNIIDRNVYLLFGSIELLKYNRESYLLWLMGFIPFNVLNKKERKLAFLKMKRVLKTNSILMFPEASHNYHPSNLINPLYDGVVNLSLKTNRKIVIITMLKDKNVSYIDVSQPISLTENKLKYTNEKEYVKRETCSIRDKMATALYHLMEAHLKIIERNNYNDIGKYFINEYCKDTF